MMSLEHCNDLLMEGIRLYNSSNFQDAYDRFNLFLNLCSYDEVALLWKGKTEIMLGKLNQAISSLKSILGSYKNPDVVAEAELFLALALYLYSYFETGEERGRVLLQAYSYAIQAEEAFRRWNDQDSKNLANWLKVMILIENNNINEALNLLKQGLQDIFHEIAMGYLDLKIGQYNSALLHIRIVSIDLKYATNFMPPYRGFFEDFLHLIEARILLEGYGKYDEALQELRKISRPNVVLLLAMLYSGQIYEKKGQLIDACNVYSSVIQFVDSPLVRERSRNLGCSQVVPVNRQDYITYRTPNKSVSFSFKYPSRNMLYSGPSENWDPNIWVGKTLSIYRVVEVLGAGGYGYVLKAITPNNEEVAIKVLKISTEIPEDYFDVLITEANNLSSLSNDPNIVKIYAIYADKFVIREILRGNFSLYESSPPMIVMEFMRGGNLQELLTNDTFYYSKNWTRTVYRAIKTIADALYQMHKKGYVHLDVKPTNIFLTERPKSPEELSRVSFKLGDLGSAVRTGGKIRQVTVEYAPPEVYIDTAKPYVDVFSLGMTMYVLLTRSLDRPDIQDMEDAFDCFVRDNVNCVENKVLSARQKLSAWDPKVPEEVKHLVKMMTDPNPLKRPTASIVSDYLSKLIT